MQQRSRAGYATHSPHRLPVEVADPDGDREPTGHADGPVIGEVMTRARLDRRGKRKIERRLQAETRDSSRRVGQNVDHQGRRSRRYETTISRRSSIRTY